MGTVEKDLALPAELTPALPIADSPPALRKTGDQRPPEPGRTVRDIGASIGESVE